MSGRLLGELLEGSVMGMLGEAALKEVSGLVYDSRHVSRGNLFFALPGLKSDGVDFVGEAVAGGAVAVVARRDVPGCGVPVIVVNEPRAVMADAAAKFYGHPSLKLKLIGITGTNGKTTTAFLCKAILDSELQRCGLIGTVKYIVGDEEREASRTTPESVDLQRMLSEMVDRGCKAAVMEVSSHALDQQRVKGIEFDAAVFTNLTQDHLDYHGTMEAYFRAKCRLFEGLAEQKKKRKGRAVVNFDDRFGQLLLDRLPRAMSRVTFGLGLRSDFRATDVRFSMAGTQYHLEARGRSYLVRLPLIGAFNVSNSLAALAATASLGFEVRGAVMALAEAPQVPGRLELVSSRKEFQVFVDYAHTEDALRNVLRTLRELGPRRLIVVVGCGGERDRGKRPLMAAAAESLADWVILTSDNPRGENPQDILSDMRRGMMHGRYEQVIDREEAIWRAVSMAGAGDIVLIAGKGHEAYQEVAGRKVPFDDVKVSRRAIDAVLAKALRGG